VEVHIIEAEVGCIGTFAAECSWKNNTNNLEILVAFFVPPTATDVEKIVLGICIYIRG
jgi:hypothetical protein